ncbi:Uncharacterised protein [uncultured archaeon]|nr:Uncharacterised protein [uncultured archaeon]
MRFAALQHPGIEKVELSNGLENLNDVCMLFLHSNGLSSVITIDLIEAWSLNEIETPENAFWRK